MIHESRLSVLDPKFVFNTCPLSLLYIENGKVFNVIISDYYEKKWQVLVDDIIN